MRGLRNMYADKGGMHAGWGGGAYVEVGDMLAGEAFMRAGVGNGGVLSGRGVVKHAVGVGG